MRLTGPLWWLVAGWVSLSAAWSESGRRDHILHLGDNRGIGDLTGDKFSEFKRPLLFEPGDALHMDRREDKTSPKEVSLDQNDACPKLDRGRLGRC